MTYALVLHYRDEPPSVYGPFESVDAAEEYACSQVEGVWEDQDVVELFNPKSV